MKKRIIAILAGILIIASVITFGMVFSIREITEVYQNGMSDLQSGDIASIAGIARGDNILGINETEATRRVSEAYPDNSLDIADIERVFPNKIIIKIKRRQPIVAIPMDNGGYALADIDFALNKTIAADGNFSDLILAEGFSVNNTFNTPELKRLRDALLAAKSAGFDDSGLCAFVASISAPAEQTIVYKLRCGGIITCQGDANELKNDFFTKYATFLALSDADRRTANL